MKIDRESWHYRLVDFWVRPSRTLCGYFWQVVFCALLVVALAVCAVGVAFLVLTIPLHWFWRELQPFAVIGGMAAAWVLVLELVRRVRLRKRRERRALTIRDVEARHKREPSLFMAWLRAKKEKVCPVLEYE